MRLNSNYKRYIYFNSFNQYWAFTLWLLLFSAAVVIKCDRQRKRSTRSEITMSSRPQNVNDYYSICMMLAGKWWQGNNLVILQLLGLSQHLFCLHAATESCTDTNSPYSALRNGTIILCPKLWLSHTCRLSELFPCSSAQEAMWLIILAQQLLSRQSVVNSCCVSQHVLLSLLPSFQQITLPNHHTKHTKANSISYNFITSLKLIEQLAKMEFLNAQFKTIMVFVFKILNFLLEQGIDGSWGER